MSKKMEHKKCGGEFVVNQNEQNLPYLVCDRCDHKIDDWIKWNEKYRLFWQDQSKWDSRRDAAVCLLGLFDSLYEKHFGTRFAFSLNERGLFKGQEMVQIRKILASLDNDAKLAKKYIEWVFANKVVQRRRKITSLGFLAHPQLINEFQQLVKKSSQIRRSTPIPAGILGWIGKNTPTVLAQLELRDCGDLHLMLTHYRNGLLENAGDLKKFVDKLQATGLVDTNLKIKNWSE
jgi:hypothetical protein